jgi:hypothetical protein
MSMKLAHIELVFENKMLRNIVGPRRDEVTRTGKQEVCDTEFRFENASEMLEVCEVVE